MTVAPVVSGLAGEAMLKDELSRLPANGLPPPKDHSWLSLTPLPGTLFGLGMLVTCVQVLAAML